LKLSEEEELLAKIVKVEERRKLIRRHGKSPILKGLLDKFLLRTEESNDPPRHQRHTLLLT
jgi:hypothetical protein